MIGNLAGIRRGGRIPLLHEQGERIDAAAGPKTQQAIDLGAQLRVLIRSGGRLLDKRAGGGAQQVGERFAAVSEGPLHGPQKMKKTARACKQYYTEKKLFLIKKDCNPCGVNPLDNPSYSMNNHAPALIEKRDP
jgi:hypothetical protein